MANGAAYRGPAVYIFSGSANLINNTITRNRATYTGGQGGGLLVWSGASASGKNNIIYDNTATSGPNVYSAATLTYSDVGGGWTGTGNIDANPLFINTPPTAWFFLSQTAAGQSQNSPCMNAGDPASQMITGTTRTDHVQDAGIVDLGFHWPITVTLADHGHSGRSVQPADAGI